jgi:hypothetical protein
MTMKRRIILCLLSSLCFISVCGQTVQGVVEDSLSHEPLEMATVTQLRKGKPIAFAMTDASGRFVLKTATLSKGDSLAATYLGYAKKVVAIPATHEMHFRLTAEAFNLREVQIRGGRIYGKRDTISYDLSRFADKRDNSLKDVLRKLPGVDIDKNGVVSYNGIAVSRFTVEGLDLTGGRYNLINENLKAKDVDRAEIIEHDQPIKALANKTTTDKVGMNIKLKPEARDKWVFTFTPVIKLGTEWKDTRLGGRLNALQIGKTQQSLYDGEIDRTGKDLSHTDQQLTAIDSRSPLSEAVMPTWYAVPSLSAPIDDERLRFNSSQAWSINRAFKTKDGSEKRLTAGYFHATERQTTDNRSLYYLNGSTPTETDRLQHLRIRTDRLQMGYNKEINTNTAYGNERFSVEGGQVNGWADISRTGSADIAQLVRLPEIDINNKYDRLRTYDNHTLFFSSVARYSHAPSSLTIDGDKQKLSTTQWYTDNNMTWLRKFGFFTQSYMAGVSAEHLSADSTGSHFSLYLYPALEYKRGACTLQLHSLLQWERFAELGHSFFNAAPLVSLSLKSGYHSEWYLYAGYRSATGQWESFLLPNYRSDYRTVITTDGTIPRHETFYSGIYYYYKRPIQGLFWNSSASISRTRNNMVTDLQIDNGQYLLRQKECANHSRAMEVKSELSKGFFAWHLKTKLAVSYSDVKGVQSATDHLLDYRNRQLSVDPQIIFSPSWGELSYSGNFGWIKSKIEQSEPLETLLHWTQRLTLTKSIGLVDISLSAVHYRNELQASPTVHTFLADGSVTWRTKKIRYELKLCNLFNQRSYSTTAYSGISSSTDSYQLRPREILFSVQWSL